MEFKNINTGNISAENVDIGDKVYNITNFIDGLSFLLTEYKQHLDEINNLILLFKLKTALDLLNGLEKRINDTKAEVDNKIKCKILFLKALCKRDLSEFTIEESAKDFINAYNLNKQDSVIRDRACVEYLNISDLSKAIELADNILELDEYNLSAWYVKITTSDNLKEFLNTVPNIVLGNYNFQHSIIYQIIRTEKLNNLDDLKNYNLQLTFDFNKYKEVDFQNKAAWVFAFDLLINKIFRDFPLRYISGENFIIQDSPEIIQIIKLLDKYVSTLENTEISEIIKLQKFYFNFFNYLQTNSDNNFLALVSLYNEIEKPVWFFTNSVCQVLNHKKEFQQCLDYLNEYENLGGKLHSEFYLFKSIVLHLLSKNDEIEDLYKKYLDSIVIIDERHMLNIINAFFEIQKHIGDKNKYKVQLDLVLEKKFKLNEIKVILKSIVELKYLENYNADEIFESLNIIKDNTRLDINCKNIIANNLDFIGRTKEAILYIDSYVDKSKVSETLRLYIILLNEQLHNKNDSEQHRYKELLNLLEFWRLNSRYVDEDLLGIEHNLYSTINDFHKLREIDELLHFKYPKNEQYLYSYLVSLERLKDFEKITEISSNISENFENEEIGVYISVILGRNNINRQKGFNIIFNLAKEQSNTFARKNYFGSSNLFNEFFVRYDEVELGHWVVYDIDNQKYKERISQNNEIHSNLIGKRIGDKITIPSKISKRINTIEIVEIFNYALSLFRDIYEEAQNPVNDLGFESFQVKDFEKMLIEQFGADGSFENERVKTLLNDYYNYRIGFTEIVRGVFKENFIDAYLHLTYDAGSKYTTLPNGITQPLNYNNSSCKFALDFSTLLLFYFLEKELNFKYIHKFKISYHIQEHIENQIVEFKNSHKTSMFVQNTLDGDRPQFVTEDYKEKKIEFLELLLEWVNQNCEIDKIEEKLDILPKFSNNEINYETNFFKLMVDNMYLSSKENYRLISSDSSNFLFKVNKGLYSNQINPEKYLTKFYSDKCNSEFYRFLLKSKYLGISINLDTLKNEFYDFITGKENYYLLVLENLQFSIHNDTNTINICIQFIKHLYLINFISIIDKNRYASEIFKNSFYGMQLILIKLYRANLMREFKLLGIYYNEVVKEFDLVVKLYH